MVTCAVVFKEHYLINRQCFLLTCVLYYGGDADMNFPTLGETKKKKKNRGISSSVTQVALSDMVSHIIGLKDNIIYYFQWT